jgi:hypothetical protein
MKVNVYLRSALFCSALASFGHSYAQEGLEDVEPMADNSESESADNLETQDYMSAPEDDSIIIDDSDLGSLDLPEEVADEDIGAKATAEDNAKSDIEDLNSAPVVEEPAVSLEAESEATKESSDEVVNQEVITEDMITEDMITEDMITEDMITEDEQEMASENETTDAANSGNQGLTESSSDDPAPDLGDDLLKEETSELAEETTDTQPKAKPQSDVKQTEREKVKRAQLALIQDGAKISADGIFGKQTAAALLAYQRKKKLNATGTFDSQTLSTLGLSRP